MQVRGKVVILTGASSGIGWDMAHELAKRGAKLGLIARREPELLKLQAELHEKQAIAEIAVADVGDRDAQHAAIASLIERLGPVDILIANAGLGAATTIEPFNMTYQESIIRVNLLGVIYGVEAVLPSMLERKTGQIVGVSSLASFKGLPGQEAYCASKAGLNSYLEGLRVRLRKSGVRVSIICPGFVRTPMVKNNPPMPFLMNSDRAARLMVGAIERDAKIFRFPIPTSLLVWGARWMPDWVIGWALKGAYNS